MARVIIHPEALARIDTAALELRARLAAEVAEDARRFAPVETGRLRNSIHADTDGDRVTVQADADYAGYVELGTHDMAAEPYLRPALYRRRDR